VGQPHGLDGSFYVTEPTPPLLAVGRLIFAVGQECEIVRRAGTDARPIIRLARLEDRASVQALYGEVLLCPRDAAPTLPDDEWWAEDLEGMRVLAQGRLLGSVKRLAAFPSCEALAVALRAGGELLVPFVSDAVREVDLERREIEVDTDFLQLESSADAPAPGRRTPSER
jgi:16S rRNA processing protein RimM